MIFPYIKTEKGHLFATPSSSHEPPLPGVGGQLFHDYTGGGIVPTSRAPRRDHGTAHHPAPDSQAVPGELRPALGGSI